jgi:CRP-like cAMP-binding protein
MPFEPLDQTTRDDFFSVREAGVRQLFENVCIIDGRVGHKVSMTQRELGQMIGMSRESTNKQLREWEERNWVRIERGGITVLALEALAAIGTPAIDL